MLSPSERSQEILALLSQRVPSSPDRSTIPPTQLRHAVPPSWYHADTLYLALGLSFPLLLWGADVIDAFNIARRDDLLEKKCFRPSLPNPCTPLNGGKGVNSPLRYSRGDHLPHMLTYMSSSHAIGTTCRTLLTGGWKNKT